MDAIVILGGIEVQINHLSREIGAPMVYMVNINTDSDTDNSVKDIYVNGERWVKA